MALIKKITGEIGSKLNRGLDILLPPLCAGCQSRVSHTHGFCGACWGKLDFIAPPYCARCGLSFAFEIDAANDVAPAPLICGACLQEEPAFAAARAPLNYTAASRELILPFKHHDLTHLAPAFARLMQQAGAKLIAESEVIVPVPLHGLRLFLRRYNQAALLASEVGCLAQKKVILGALLRTRAVPPQGGLSRRQRMENVKGIFSVNEKAKEKIVGKAVLLIDDVLTTGATANACARALHAAGSGAVRVLTLARVAKDHD